jgi:hypothetical protein
MHRLNICRNDLQLRQLRLQPRQRRAQLLQLGFERSTKRSIMPPSSWLSVSRRYFSSPRLRATL